MLKKRTERCVCKYCGGELQLRRIIFGKNVDARVEIFCKKCDRIEFGIKKEIYASAKFFVEESGFNCFQDMEKNEQTKQLTVAKVCEIMAWHDQNIDILGKDGFKVELSMNESFLGGCIILTDEELEIPLETLIDC